MIDSRYLHPQEPAALLRAQHNPLDAGIPVDLSTCWYEWEFKGKTKGCRGHACTAYHRAPSCRGAGGEQSWTGARVCLSTHREGFGVGLQPLTLHHSPRVLPSSNQLVPNFHLLCAAHHGKGQMSLKQSQRQGLSAWGNLSEIS